MDGAEERFETVRRQIDDLAKRFPDGIIVIGGYAVFLHTQRRGLLRPERTRDGDFMMTRARYEELKRIREVTDNPRLGKHEFKDGKVGFDIYLEHESNQLPLNYATVSDWSTIINGVRIACLEHLLILKMRAMNDRKESEHGLKDERDIVKIVTMLGNPNPSAFGEHLTEKSLSELEAIEHDAAVFNEIAHGNRHEAAKIRKEYSENFSALKISLEARRKERGNET